MNTSKIIKIKKKTIDIKYFPKVTLKRSVQTLHSTSITITENIREYKKKPKGA